ncbi:MAG: pilus assembly protein TadG-related protein [Candidatus Geothermincolia bacterium]
MRGRDRAEERGAITVIVAVLIPVFLLVGSVLFDVMVVYRAKGEAQTAADAAAKAAGLELSPFFGVGSDPRAAAARFAGLNGAELIAIAIEGGGWSGRVSVTVRRRCEPLLMDLAGGPVWVQARATAYLQPPFP